MRQISVAALWTLTPASQAAVQCSMCRTGLLSSPEGQQLAAGFNSGILLLLAVPVGIILSVLLLLWRASRRGLGSPAPDRPLSWKNDCSLAMVVSPQGRRPATAEISKQA
jgi:hypothetical protein